MYFHSQWAHLHSYAIKFDIASIIVHLKPNSLGSSISKRYELWGITSMNVLNNNRFIVT